MSGYSLGSILGFPIRVRVSFLLLLGIVFLFLGGLPGLFTVSVAFASVLAHELGHAVVARRLSVPIAEIELNIFGGAAKMIGMPRSARDEIAIAAAGPAVSLALSLVAFALLSLIPHPFLALLATVNLVIAVFNLLPALPMDGGRILRAVLARRMGFLPATELAVRVSKGFSVLMVVVGLFTLHLQLVALAVVLWLMGIKELAVARLRGYRGAQRAPTDPMSPMSPLSDPLAAALRFGFIPGAFQGSGFAEQRDDLPRWQSVRVRPVKTDEGRGSTPPDDGDSPGVSTSSAPSQVVEAEYIPPGAPLRREGPEPSAHPQGRSAGFSGGPGPGGFRRVVIVRHG